MGKKVYTVEGKYYILDDETGEPKQLVIQDNQNIPQEIVLKKIKILATEKGE